ncbi:hypothetical protein MTX26_21440 [Bradyrhizobium sp. ISRA443]|uniref:hypothetical protein n=1 Tax=unclassified Bradyrhizobium TaxID=2631580 RepID=UPI002479B6DE|nr:MULTISPECIES: hypothetical protein [unclassified Bradyrhizobium]WGR97007.1 hypothetical protein MTX23_21440 [Bradyrhizobium sp. ISRA436]WGS03894.1 hypothetical protein MTX18_21440 [Bradyrhizobium sp. ISRA437]WGS10778.1 hypothetical protein MTX26_21440 [Bradyrhizobium sp. ISRA443]
MSPASTNCSRPARGFDRAFRDAIAADEGFALAHIALARTLQVLGRGNEAKAPLERALALAPATTSREQGHIAIFAKILSGQGAAAVSAIAEHMKHSPRDAMVLGCHGAGTGHRCLRLDRLLG